MVDSIANGSTFEHDKNARIVACFDHEEVGSSSMAGAGSNLLAHVISRINKGDSELMETSIRRSLLISADNAHAIHPNYASKHESNHQPKMHSGIVIKVNANQRYSTNSSTSFLFSKIAEEVNAPYQKFVVRQDMGCGSTIGMCFFHLKISSLENTINYFFDVVYSYRSDLIYRARDAYH